MNLSAISQSAPTITRRSFIGIACIAGISLAFDSISAYAAPTWGTSLKKTVGGITYTYASGYELGANPQAYVRINASKSVAAKTMQACAYVIKESNLNIVASSGWAKNAGGTSSLQTTVASSSLKLGLRSCGKVIIAGVSGQLWCNPIKPRSLPPELAVNENGQTLGTYLDAERGSVPDLWPTPASTATPTGSSSTPRTARRSSPSTPRTAPPKSASSPSATSSGA